MVWGFCLLFPRLAEAGVGGPFHYTTAPYKIYNYLIWLNYLLHIINYHNMHKYLLHIIIAYTLNSYFLHHLFYGLVNIFNGFIEMSLKIIFFCEQNRDIKILFNPIKPLYQKSYFTYVRKKFKPIISNI